MRAVLLLVPLCLAACATFPEVDKAEVGLVEGPPPVLLPSDQVIARTSLAGATPNPQASVEARAAALQSRAARIRAPGT